MASIIFVPTDWVENVAALHLPPGANRRVQDLMHRNNDGRLAMSELEELEAWVEISESFSLVRAQALLLLGRRTNE